MTSQSDESLVALVQAGHERAFTAIVERYGPELYAFARRLSADGNGEDILQQAFLGAFAALRAGAEVQHLRGWLYRIVRNSAARSRTPGYVPLDGATASVEALEDIVEQRALALDALAELARLPSRQRQAIVEMALDGRPRAEVAGSMGLSEGAVRQLVHRARARLRTVVTAVTPWPVARWIWGGPPGGGGAVDVAAGAGVASSGGFVGLKLGVVLASGAIATGVAAVGIHGAHHARAPWPIARAAAPAGHRHAARSPVQRVEFAAMAPAIVARAAAPAPAVVTRVVYNAPARPSGAASTSVAVQHSDRSGQRDRASTVERPAHHDGSRNGDGRREGASSGKGDGVIDTSANGTDGSVGGTDGSVGGTDGSVGGTDGSVGGTAGSVGGTAGSVGGTAGSVGGTDASFRGPDEGVVSGSGSGGAGVPGAATGGDPTGSGARDGGGVSAGGLPGGGPSGSGTGFAGGQSAWPASASASSIASRDH